MEGNSFIRDHTFQIRVMFGKLESPPIHQNPTLLPQSYDSCKFRKESKKKCAGTEIYTINAVNLVDFSLSNRSIAHRLLSRLKPGDTAKVYWYNSF